MLSDLQKKVLLRTFFRELAAKTYPVTMLPERLITACRMTSRERVYFLWFCFTGFLATEFLFAMLPGTNVCGRVLSGVALFVGIAIMIQTPSRIRNSFGRRSPVAVLAVVAECVGIVLAILLLGRWLLPAEIDFDDGQRDVIARMIKSGALVEERPGVVVLPPRSPRILRSTGKPTSRTGRTGRFTSSKRWSCRCDKSNFGDSFTRPFRSITLSHGRATAFRLSK